MTNKKILIVEDQRYPLQALKYAVSKMMPRYYEEFTKADYEVAKCYSSAKEKISSNKYWTVLLDNRMPYLDQGNLEDRDMERFSASLEEIGYNLIPLIKSRNPKTIVIGTSSLSQRDLRGSPTPDFTMSKMWGDAEKDLDRILKNIQRNERGGE